MKGYSNRQAKRAEADRLRAQTIIASEFEVQILAATKRLCQEKCKYFEPGCLHGLLPLTRSGEDCPYYLHR